MRICTGFNTFSVLTPLCHSMASTCPGTKHMELSICSCKVAVMLWQCIHTSSLTHTGLRRFRRPNAWAPTFVGTKLLCPSPPERLRKSAKRWVTQVAVLHPRFCVVALLEAMQREDKQWHSLSGGYR